MMIGTEEILRVLNEDNNKGFNLLFDRFYRPLVVFADSFIKDIPSSEDIVQDIFYSFIKLKSYKKLEGRTLDTYLFRAVKNACLNKVKKKDSVDNKLDLLKIEAVEEEAKVLNEKLISDIKAEIDNLPDRTRLVVKSILLNGKRYKEVAQENNISVNTVKTLLRNGVGALRAKFTDVSEMFLYLFLKKM